MYMKGVQYGQEEVAWPTMHQAHVAKAEQCRNIDTLAFEEPRLLILHPALVTRRETGEKGDVTTGRGGSKGLQVAPRLLMSF